MEEDQEYKYICKVCKKGFPCGRSLGGHMRSHMNNSTVEIDEKESNTSTLMVGFEGNSHTGYGLRENPKKTWRISDSRERKGFICKDCGKEFQSWKSLFTHMKCHLGRENKVNSYSFDEEEQEDSWVGDNHQSEEEEEEDEETELPTRRRRSRSTRYHKNPNSTTTNSCLSEIEHEQEEVAMSLMMLSRDHSSSFRLELNNSLVESSDNNNSMFSESRSSSLVKNNVEDKKSRGKKKLGSHNWEPKNAQFDRKRSELVHSGSGFSRNKIKEVESEVSVHGFFENDDDDDEYKKSSSIRKGVKSSKKTELGKNLVNEFEDQTEMKYNNSSKRTRFDDFDLEFDRKKVKTDVSGSEIRKKSTKKTKYKCMTCDKYFHSYQALGGHRASHKRMKGYFASQIENSEASTETEISHDNKTDNKLKKSSENERFVELEVPGSPENSYRLKKSNHECPICFRVFLSGQALGGHKRSHMAGGSDSRTSQTNAVQQNQPVIRDLLDLNLPAPEEDSESVNGDVDFKPWWVESNHIHEQLVDS